MPSGIRGQARPPKAPHKRRPVRPNGSGSVSLLLAGKARHRLPPATGRIDIETIGIKSSGDLARQKRQLVDLAASRSRPHGQRALAWGAAVILDRLERLAALGADDDINDLYVEDAFTTAANAATALYSLIVDGSVDDLEEYVA